MPLPGNRYLPVEDTMKRFGTLLLLLIATRIHAATLVINEVAPADSSCDWVELFFSGGGREQVDISPLFVTMYYGTNERLAASPVTLYSHDRPETPWDDRFAVVHLTDPLTPDETDLTGDTNGNGRIDLYCNNYASSLWNSDCVVAIDTDDDPANGGIIDFVAYSNRDGTPNASIVSYAAEAQKAGQWSACAGDNPQTCMVDIGPNGLEAHMSLARKEAGDTNSLNDFAITSFRTPGRPNIFSGEMPRTGSLFSTERSRVPVRPSPSGGRAEIPILVFEQCDVRLRVFSTIGMTLHRSELRRDLPPGRHILTWDCLSSGRPAQTGLYIAQIEAASSQLRRSQTERVFIIIGGRQ